MPTDTCRIGTHATRVRDLLAVGVPPPVGMVAAAAMTGTEVRGGPDPTGVVDAGRPDSS